ncbi:cyclophilin-like fold protein [Streptomyces sp. NPDC056105]|uniref:cyclophilin-like fold protein n=1 Tax=Streptomyces sp. NPDC056105 TaxID=3345714 RepID=UPI0035D89F3B
MTTFALVGAGPGLGLATARRFGSAGHSVALLSRSAEHLENLATELDRDGIEARGFTTDVLDPASLTTALRTAGETLGPIEILQYSPVPRADFMKPVTACSNDAPEAPTSPAASSGRQQASATTQSNSDRNNAMDIRLTLDGRPVDGTLNDSPAARDLATLLLLTLDLEDFHGTERIGCPPRKLETLGAPEPVAPKAGDLAYYAPWGNLALFYRDGASASADLLILGRTEADADRLAGADRITIEAAS